MQVKLTESIFEKEKQIIEIEKSQAMGEQAKEIAQLKFEKLGMQQELSQLRIQEGIVHRSAYNNILTVLGLSGQELTMADILSSPTYSSNIKIGPVKGESKNEEETEDDEK